MLEPAWEAWLTIAATVARRRASLWRVAVLSLVPHSLRFFLPLHCALRSVVAMLLARCSAAAAARRPPLAPPERTLRHLTRRARASQPAARFVPQALHALHTQAMAKQEAAAAAAAAAAEGSATAFPAASPDVDLPPSDADREEQSASAESRAYHPRHEVYDEARTAASRAASASISAANLSAYYTLLDTPQPQSTATTATPRGRPPKSSFVYRVDHRPLRTTLKTDSQLVIPQLKMENALATLPFSMEALRQMLQRPFATELVQQQQIAAASAAAAASNAAAAARSTSRPVAAAAPSVPGMATDMRPKPAQSKSQPRAKKATVGAQQTLSADHPLGSLFAAPAAAPAVIEPTVPAATPTDDLHSLRSLLVMQGPFLREMQRLQQRGDHALVARAFRELVEPQLNQAIARLDFFIAQQSRSHRLSDDSAVATAAEVDPSDASATTSALSFIHSLQHPLPFLDSATSLALGSCLALGDNRSAKSAFASLMRFQQRQHECFELHLWELSVSIMEDAHRKHMRVDARSLTPLSSSSAGLHTGSALAKQFLDAREPFNPFHAKPYVHFISELMQPNRLHKPALTAAQLKDTKKNAAALAEARRMRRIPVHKRVQAVLGVSSSASSPAPAAVMPKVKPALQLFNRLLDQPSSVSLTLTAAPAVDSSPNSLQSPTAFRFSWPKLTKTMLRGIVDVAAHEVVALQTRHATVLDAADRAGEARAHFGRSTAAVDAAHSLAAFDSLPESEVLAALRDFAKKKSEVLELMQGISMHVLRSFIRNPAATAAATTSDSSANPSVTAYTVDNLRHKQWNLVKLLLCQTVQAFNDTASKDDETADASEAALDPSKPPPSNWSKRALHALTPNEILDQRDRIRAELLALFPGVVTTELLDQAHLQPTPALQRDVFRALETLQDTHLNLVHAVLEAYIQLCAAFAPAEARAERVRTSLEHKMARRGRQIADAQIADLAGPLKALSTQTRERARAHKALLEQLHSVPLPSSPIRHIDALLHYMEQELIMPRAHTFSLLFHKALYGGGLLPSVRYARSQPAVAEDASAAADPRVVSSSVHDLAVKPGGGDPGSEEHDLRVLLAMLTNCGPQYRRVPARVPGVSSDLISSLLIDIVLPRPVTLYNLPQVRPKRNDGKIARMMPQTHSKLFEAHSTALLHVLERQRRRHAKEETVMLLAGSHPSQLGAAADLSAAASSAAASSDALSTADSSSVDALHPFTLSHDQSGFLSTVLGSVDHVLSHPVKSQVRAHVRAVLNRETGASVVRLPRLMSRRLFDAHTGFVATTRHENQQREEARRAGSPVPLKGWQIKEVRSSLKLGRLVAQKRRSRMQRLHGEWKHRDRYMFNMWEKGQFNPKDTTAALQLRPDGHSSLVQLPSYLIPPRTYHGLLRYFARTNNLAGALDVYNRMRHSWVSLSFDAALDLVELAVKYMNYSVLATLMEREALPLSRTSHSRRARLWHVLIRGFARYNSYSNVDTYMRYLLRLLTPVSHVDYQLRTLLAAHAGVADEPADTTLSPPPSVRDRRSARVLADATPIHKRQLDELWSAWVARGGANEVLALWDTLRASAASFPDHHELALQEQQRDGNTPAVSAPVSFPRLDVPIDALLDDVSIDAFLAGALHRVRAGESPSSGLHGLASLDAVAGLLRHLAKFGRKLNDAHIRRIAADLPILVIESRKVVPGSPLPPVQKGASEHSLRMLMRDNFTSDAAWRNFCATFHVAPELEAISNNEDTDLTAMERRVALHAAAAERPSTTLRTRAEVRTAVLAAMLRSLNQRTSTGGIEYAAQVLESSPQWADIGAHKSR